MCPTCHTMGARPPGRAAASSSDTSWRACSSHWAVNSSCLRISSLIGLNTSWAHISPLGVPVPLSNADRRSVHHHYGGDGADGVDFGDTGGDGVGRHVMSLFSSLAAAAATRPAASATMTSTGSHGNAPSRNSARPVICTYTETLRQAGT